MNRGGIETWLMHVLRGIDRTKFDFHFLVHTNQKAAYDDEIRSLGAQIHDCGVWRNPIKYSRRFKTIIDRHGPFQVIHSHVYLYSGFIMRLAAAAGIPIRIAHCHTAPRNGLSNPARLIYNQLMRNWIADHSTHCVGVSKVAASSFPNKGSQSTSVMYCGLDFTRFLNHEDSGKVRDQLGIPRERKVIGHVGRFTPVKNHNFVIQFFERIVASGTDAHLLLVGDGPLVPAVRELVRARGLSDRCTFAGLQDDVAPYLFAMDVFVLPSLHEGLGLAALEAQAAGLPVVISADLPEEIEVVSGAVARIPLEAGVSAWASAVISKLQPGSRIPGDEVVRLQNSKFASDVCIETLSRVYSGGCFEDLEVDSVA